MLRRKILSSGGCPSLYENYRQTVSFLGCLLSLLCLLIVTITAADLRLTTSLEQEQLVNVEEAYIKAIQTVSGVYIVVQLVLACIELTHLTCGWLHRSDTFFLTISTRPKKEKPKCLYGTANGSLSPELNADDITVYYHRVPGGSCNEACEPLGLPLQGWVLPGQVFCLLLLTLVTTLYACLEAVKSSSTEKAVQFHQSRQSSSLYETWTAFSVLSWLLQSLLLLCTYITSTDTGCCFPGICSITRWFMHRDIYAEILERRVRESYGTQMAVGSEEWFRSSLVGSYMSSGLDRTGQEKRLQELLEAAHEDCYREVFVGRDAVSLFITRSERDSLVEFYAKRGLTNCRSNDELTLYQRNQTLNG